MAHTPEDDFGAVPAPRPAGHGPGARLPLPLDALAADLPEAGYRPLTRAEAKRSLERAWAEAALTPEDRVKYRRLVAWRITREIATRQGLLGLMDPLMALREDPIDAWCGGASRLPHHPKPGFDARRPLEDWATADLLFFEGGLPLAPAADGRDGERFAHLVRRLVVETRVYEGSPRVPNLWHYAYGDVQTNAELLAAWPSRTEIEFFEEGVMRHAHASLIEKSRVNVAEDLHLLLGIDRTQAMALTRMSVVEYSKLSYEDLEEKRYLMEQRVQDMIERAREASDMDAEAKGYKLLAAVQGLTRTDPTTATDEIIKTISAISKEADSAKPRQLRAIEADDLVDDLPQTGTA